MTLLILLFIFFSVSIFFISKIEILVFISILNLSLFLIFKIKFKNYIVFILKSLFFLVIVFAFNLLFDGVISSLIVVWRIFLVLNISFLYSQKFSYTKIADGISGLLLPLKIFKINTEQIAIIIVIGLNFIPILKNELIELKKTLFARNVKINIKTIFTKSHLLFILFFSKLFKKVDELELALKMRNFDL